ncbi:natural resistance-associated macrophage protein [Cryphonectria parasitica EP155]|uniref:Natural resistance-associated macrophage protein n=1 Tax=Cryphonectria parasitica (strain ATCC 38755 / EP155) TaxID=660469 RepID=A0A9P4Y4C5_CRYP1|nr:natural resistance-associated macrophage protein [Cryphonectria parasitica EP155]KAF3765930.1 natural resistance-associated macrophage protein [Cryphonectria parasitica EP155]
MPDIVPSQDAYERGEIDKQLGTAVQSQSSHQDGSSILARIRRFCAFLGPGAIISVAYIDPDNYQTAISSGGSFQYKLLFMVLVSNLIAIYLQALCVKLGTVTGLDLAQLNHRHLPRWLDLSIYAIAEACIICTDLGQVIGTAISLNILIPKLPLSAACCISVVETLLILLFYKPNGELRRIRLFEVFIGMLVAAVFFTICLLLARISAPAGPVFKGFLPSRDIFVGEGLYESCALLGGTLMPHTIYLGTALSRSRLYNFDEKHNLISPSVSSESLYRPSLQAIRSCLSYSVAELCITLGTVAVFTNSALVIISGAAFYGPGSDDLSDDIYSLHDLFSSVIAPAAGTLFAVSLLFSGVSAGIVATMAGQVVMEGALQIRVSPFVRRLTTRCVAIIPALVVAVSVGQDGLSQALVACNYILAIGLIFVTFPLVYYTSTARYMSVPSDEGTGLVSMSNNLATTTVAYLIWAAVVFMDLATVVLVGMGIEDD